MIQLRHTGIYVKNLQLMTKFYQNTFNMYIVVNEYEQCDELIKDILHDQSAKVKITKLITEQGKVSGFDDMIELIEVVNYKNTLTEVSKRELFSTGSMHVCFFVSDMERTLDKARKNGGTIISDIHIIGGNSCCFLRDPEGNFIEVIAKCDNNI